MIVPNPTSSERISLIIRRIVEEICNKGDLDLADRLFTATYMNHGGLIPELIHGPEAIKFAVVTARLAFPGLRIVIDDLVVEGQAAEFRWTALARPPSGGQGSPARRIVVRLTGVTLARLAAGQVTESWTRWDTNHEGAMLLQPTISSGQVVARLMPIPLALPTGALGRPDRRDSIRKTASF